jgi:hypothetical protein
MGAQLPPFSYGPGSSVRSKFIRIQNGLLYCQLRRIFTAREFQLLYSIRFSVRKMKLD